MRHTRDCMAKPGESSPTGMNSINVQTITVASLQFFVEKYLSSDIRPIEVKKTTAAKLKRSSENIQFESAPHGLLPGSGCEFTVKFDKDGHYVFQRIIPKDIENYMVSIHNSETQTSSKFKLERNESQTLLDCINFTHHYLLQIHSRAQGEDLSKKYAVIPVELHQMILSLEGFFSNGPESALLPAIKQHLQNLKKFLQTLSGDFKASLHTLQKDIANANKISPFTPHDPVMSRILPIPFYDDEDWNTGKMTAIYRLYLGNLAPNQFNQVYVKGMLKSLVREVLSHGPDTLVDDQISSRSTPLPKIALHFPLDGIQEAYKEVNLKVTPILDALHEQKRQNQSGVDESIALCQSIQGVCKNQVTTSSIVQHSPKQLASQVSMLTQKHKLTKIMAQEIENEFPAYFEAQDKESLTWIDESFSLIKSLKGKFDECEDLLKTSREYISEKAVLKDVGVVRQDGHERINSFRDDLKAHRNRLESLDDLETEVKSTFEEIEEWFEEFKDSFSGENKEGSLLWIGLGQAGGQILRECITFCLSNLSDARCSALLTALGITGEHKKNLYSLVKEVNSENLQERRKAESAIKNIFDKKVHLLAINLGEEVDKLAKNDAPGYYYWGNEFKSDKASNVTRSRRNILKLIDTGDGAGGATGIGRAFGFRYATDISEAMKDVGKKGNRTPEHIVITHSLAGGSGSGMVLPVLERARKTFGEKPVIWVISVGEGSSEKRSTAKVNTPFIISDILQAHYDGIHAIHDPIEISHIRKFERQIKDASTEMVRESKSLIHALSTKHCVKLDDKSSMKTEEIFAKFNVHFNGGTEGVRGTQMIEEFIEAAASMKELNGRGVAEKGLNLGKLPREMFSGINSETVKAMIGTKQLVLDALGTLPEDAENAKYFSNWCTEEETGGVRPAVQFWNQWIKLARDPLTLLIRGRDEVKQSQSEEGDKRKEVLHYEPDLTGDQIKSVIRRLHSERKIKLGSKIPEFKVTKPGLESLYSSLDKVITDAEDSTEKLNQLRGIIESYAGSLAKYNSAMSKIHRHILSLSGSGSDVGVKSIIVSNRHLEMGVETSNHIHSSGDAYTVFNSVIFDLMLNIIGPRLPSEPGVYINSDVEEFDHKDMVSITEPPLVVGLLNQRDSASLSEAVSIKPTGSTYKIPEAFTRMVNSLVSSLQINPRAASPVKNIAFITQRPSQKYQDLFTGMFGSRYRYMLDTNPYDVIDMAGPERSDLDGFCQTVASLWDDSSDLVYDTTANERDQLSRAYGVSGLHIANLLRWYSLIELSVLCDFISKNHAESKMYQSQIEENDTTLWSSNQNMTRQFDIGIIRTSNSLQKYNNIVPSLVNENLLQRVLPKMGVFTAEVLRALAPAYFTSFLPLAIINEGKAIMDKYFENNLQPIGEIGKDEIAEFAKTMWGEIIENHTLQLDGELDLGDIHDEEGMYQEWILYSNEINHVLDTIDLKLSFKHGTAYLAIHPRVERYLSVLRDVPSDTSDRFLPSRSAPASLARYLYSNSEEDPLDKNPNMRKRTGIASPTFAMGLDILNQMRISTLLPDEMRLSFVPLLRILLMSSQDAETVLNNLERQLETAGVSKEQVRPHFERILNQNRYGPLDGYSDPTSYCKQTQTTIHRLHDLRELLEYLQANLPERWTKNDVAGMTFVQDNVLFTDEENALTYSNKEEATELLSGKEPTKELREWAQNIINLVVKQDSVDGLEREELQTSVSNQNPTVIKAKQLFYDISTYTSESLQQAEYLDGDDSSGKERGRSVHFEMTGFSDRLLGQPDGLLTLVHDRNPRLPMNVIKANSRESLSHFICGESEFGNPKEFSTAADFGPTSFLTMVFTKAPSADVADQFHELMFNQTTGFGSDDPFWAFKNSKLHPYLLLYNTLWLSVNSIGTWSRRSNRLYSRRFQIPKRIIETHFSVPRKIDIDRKRIENEKADFPGDVFMPKTDHSAYANAVRPRENRLTGHRNIIKQIAIMALRHNFVEKDNDSRYWKDIVNESEFKQMVEIVDPVDYQQIHVDHLITPVTEGGKSTKRSKLGGFGKKQRNRKNPSGGKETIEDRAKAWFQAYKNWLDFTSDVTPEALETTRQGDAELFRSSFSIESDGVSQELTLNHEDLAGSEQVHGDSEQHL
jgi:hypothetical protein